MEELIRSSDSDSIRQLRSELSQFREDAGKYQYRVKQEMAMMAKESEIRTRELFQATEAISRQQSELMASEQLNSEQRDALALQQGLTRSELMNLRTEEAQARLRSETHEYKRRFTSEVQEEWQK